MREGLVTPCRPRSHYRCRVSVLAANSLDLDRGLQRRSRLVGSRFALRRILRLAPRLWLRVADRLGLRVTDRLSQHRIQVSLGLLDYLIAHRSPPVTVETTVARQRCPARRPTD